MEQGRAELIAVRNEGDTAPDNSASLIMAEALLGNRPAVEREGEALLRAIGPDRWELPRAQVSVARAYAMLKDAGHAVPLLRAALDAPMSDTPTPALLRIDPSWDNIRSDPRFEKLSSSGGR